MWVHEVLSKKSDMEYSSPDPDPINVALKILV